MAGIELRSPSFGDYQPIPARHAKDHDNLSPALEWSGVPEEAGELAVLCEDPDAPSGTFTYWVLAGLQPTATGLAEREHPAAAVEGRNDFGEEGYGGPMPPVGDGPHRYFFRVYAASAPLGLTGAPSAEDPVPRLGGQGAGQRHPRRHLPALTAARSMLAAPLPCSATSVPACPAIR
jgi:Raf kinase inhibitor-like YbhB/YbcL family protein